MKSWQVRKDRAAHDLGPDRPFVQVWDRGRGIIVDKLTGPIKPPAPECWKVHKARVTNCGWVNKDAGGRITLPLSIHIKILAITKRIDNLEWLGYLIGSAKDNEYTVTEIAIPDQAVTGGSVVVISQAPPETIGTVHLHPFTGTPSLSGTDESYIGGNHLVTIVTNKTGEYKAQVKKILPCGSSFLVNASVEVILPGAEKLSVFVEEALKLIREEKPEPPATIIYPGTPEIPMKDLNRKNDYQCTWCNKEITRAEAHWLGQTIVCPDCFKLNKTGNIVYCP